MNSIRFITVCSLLVGCVNAQNFDASLSMQQAIPATSSITTATTSPQNFSFQIDATQKEYSKLKCLVLCVGESEELVKLGKLIKFDLEITDQLDVDVQKTETEPDAKILPKLFNRGTSLCLFLKPKNHNKLQVSLKEPSSTTELFSKEFSLGKDSLVYDGHSISSELFPVLIGKKVPVLGSLAYCKQISPKQKAICVSDYACKREKIVCASRTINVAPRWHSKAPVVFFSQFTKNNNRLMSLDLHTGIQKIVCSYDGLSMQPSFSQDGVKAVLCMSGRGNSELYMYDQSLCNKLKHRAFMPLTNNKGNNVSPCLLPNGDIIFCSDYETGLPQIYYLNEKTKLLKRLTNGKGYCAAPAYCSSTNTIAYCRYVRSVFQLFTINLKDKNPVERQLTFDRSDKQEPTWSECGNYLAFSYDQYNNEVRHKVSQIALLNTMSKKIHILTSGRDAKSFPCWVNEPYFK